MPTPLASAITSEADLEIQLAALIAAAPELALVAVRTGALPRRPLGADYAGLVWVVSGQQISVAAGRAIFNRLDAALGGITPEALLAASDEVLKTAGMSAQKTRTLRAAAEAIRGGLNLGALAGVEAEEAIAALSRIRGVGRWTAEVFLLFAAGHPDIFPAGDLALQEAARLAFGLDERPKEAALRARAETWRPHRSIAARLLWAYYGVARNGRDATPV